jgi:N-methylhydantoinase A/oxoprolinase/acetone carboxylase beta subunit
VERFIHGTTVATNAMLEQKGAVTAILTTEGFEDVLELGRRSARACTTSTWIRRTPTFLAPRRRRLGIRERLDARGAVLVPLDEDRCASGHRAAHRDGAQAIAVCYLFSFVNPAHERRTARDLPEMAPEISVSLSSEVDPTFREYERLCVTAFDAYLGPVVKRYLAGWPRCCAASASLRAARHALAGRHRVGGAGRAAAGHRSSSRAAAGVVGARFAAERSDVRTSSRSTWAARATTWRW